VRTPNFDRFAEESLLITDAYPESLPTLPARRAIYTGRRTYPFHDGEFHLKGDFVGAPGWGPIPEDHPTLAELLRRAGYRTGLVSDVYHMFKPSKNFWRGFDQWVFLRGQEVDPARSGPRLTGEEIDFWLPKEFQNRFTVRFVQRCIMNIRDRTREEDYFAPRVLREAARWLEQNRDADRFFLTIESFDPHEPWLVPAHYRDMYLEEKGREQVISLYRDVPDVDPRLIARTRANYSGSVTQCDRWFGFFMEALGALGLLDDTLVILTSDHGHSIGDRDYLGKRGYPSSPEVHEIPLLVRLPRAEHAGARRELFVQHHDIFATVLEAAEVDAPSEMEAISFLESVVSGREGARDHATVGWGAAATVVTDRWWLNCKVDGTGVLLHDLTAPEPFGPNVADANPRVVDELFALARRDAGGSFPNWILELARQQEDAPGCSDLAARA
jgi:arylsulfatase A-like enzyme